MDSMEVNKGIAAILIGGILFFLTGLIGDSLVRERLPEKPALAIATAPTTSGGETKPTGPAPIEPLLASANVQDGEQFTHKICIACHTFDKGGKPGLGPNLFGVVGGPHDHEEGFSYSPAMEKYKGQPWTFDALNEWLYKPSAYAPGTRMSFVGITNDKQRADVIAYLNSNSDHPLALPQPGASPPRTATQTQSTGGSTSTPAPQPNAPAASSQPAGAPGQGPPAGGSASAPAAPAKP